MPSEYKRGVTELLEVPYIFRNNTIMDLVDGPSLSYEDFCKHYMAKNKPVRIASVNEKWFTSTRAWVTESQSNTGVGINYPLLRKLYGHHNVPVRQIKP